MLACGTNGIHEQWWWGEGRGSGHRPPPPNCFCIPIPIPSFPQLSHASKPPFLWSYQQRLSRPRLYLQPCKHRVKLHDVHILPPTPTKSITLPPLVPPPPPPYENPGAPAVYKQYCVTFDLVSINKTSLLPVAPWELQNVTYMYENLWGNIGMSDISTIIQCISKIIYLMIYVTHMIVSMGGGGGGGGTHPGIR